MRMVDLIEKKKCGLELTSDEISFIIKGIMSGEIPDYQMSAFLMAVCFQGMTDQEATSLTFAMRDSGKILDLSSVPGKKIDKHSSGGVGDKTTLVLAPIIASLDVPVSKMSGRGLGFTGGTIDKLACIHPFSSPDSMDDYVNMIREHKIAISEQTGDLAPADGILYALRDATDTVQSIPLIASSIMSKKLASGCDGIVLDVTCGSGAFMTNLEDASHLAKLMITIGKSCGKSMAAVITSMDEPLGYAIGNILEVKEAIMALHGQGPDDLMEVVYKLGSYMLLLADRTDNLSDARKLMEEQVNNGKAYAKFREWVVLQGDASAGKLVDMPASFPRAERIDVIIAEEDGYIKMIDAKALGTAVMMLGGGRKEKGDSIDETAGIVLHAKVADYVKKGDPLLEVHWNPKDGREEAFQLIRKAFVMSKEKTEPVKLILGEFT